jgi:DNA-binding transcriptional LysR family regulator
MELRHFRYFVAVAEELHFGRAAARLNMAQPPLSQQIRQLEEELGVTLLRRSRRRVELTDAGQAFLAGARTTLAEADQAAAAARRAATGEMGRLAIGFVGSGAYSVLPEMLGAFRRQFPDVELVLRQATTAQQVSSLRAGRLDVGLLHLPLGDDGLTCRTVLREPLVVALPDGHPLAVQDIVPFTSLAAAAFVMFPRHLGPGLYDRIIGACQQAGFIPRVVQEAANMETITALVAAGLGIALTPASVRHLRRPGVVYRSLSNSPMGEMALAWLPGNRRGVLERFVEVALAAGESLEGSA